MTCAVGWTFLSVSVGQECPTYSLTFSAVQLNSAMIRLGLICDFLEENWPSMDLVAEMLYSQIPRWPDVRVERIRPPMNWRLTRLPLITKSRFAFNGDRLLNRFWDFPRHLRSRLAEFDGFHIC